VLFAIFSDLFLGAAERRVLASAVKMGMLLSPNM
jgi:hypothetical protein